MSYEHEKHNVCISVSKVYDWVTRQVDLPTMCYKDGKKEDELAELFKCKNIDDCDSFSDFMKKYPKSKAVCRVLDSKFYTKEITDPDDRTQVEVSMPNGKEVVLEKVKVLIKVFIEVDIYDEFGEHLCTSCEPLEFTKIETFYLCAPEGTDVCAYITSGQCDAEIICDGDYTQLDVSFSFCLDVHVLADVLLEIDAAYCKPRHEFPISDVICHENKFPPQCPVIFPGKYSDKKSTATVSS
ncbi:hypothetical protein [Shouchella shacheensis]|uniref:hypothetical protein n=1 Tax=Shouchella shacheensis TaxID=1649580 RepID=UPI00073FEC49|nr:hypothetical protein [Shouchella shacheensis]